MRCPNCGSTAFAPTEHGHYVCQRCSTQSQEVAEVNEVDDSQYRSSQFRKSKRVQVERAPLSGDESAGSSDGAGDRQRHSTAVSDLEAARALQTLLREQVLVLLRDLRPAQGQQTQEPGQGPNPVDADAFLDTAGSLWLHRVRSVLAQRAALDVQQLQLQQLSQSSVRSWRKSALAVSRQRYLRPIDTLAVCYLTCVWYRQPVLLQDFVLWACDGRLPYFGLPFLRSVPRVSSLARAVGRVLHALPPAWHFEPPPLPALVQRVCASLRLPPEVHDWALYLTRRLPLVPLQMAHMRAATSLLPETPALALAVVAARLWFGLGATEAATVRAAAWAQWRQQEGDGQRHVPWNRSALRTVANRRWYVRRVGEMLFRDPPLPDLEDTLVGITHWIAPPPLPAGPMLMGPPASLPRRPPAPPAATAATGAAAGPIAGAAVGPSPLLRPQLRSLERPPALTLAPPGDAAPPTGLPPTAALDGDGAAAGQGVAGDEPPWLRLEEAASRLVAFRCAHVTPSACDDGDHGPLEVLLQRASQLSGVPVHRLCAAVARVERALALGVARERHGPPRRFEPRLAEGVDDDDDDDDDEHVSVNEIDDRIAGSRGDGGAEARRLGQKSKSQSPPAPPLPRPMLPARLPGPFRRIRQRRTVGPVAKRPRQARLDAQASDDEDAAPASLTL